MLDQDLLDTGVNNSTMSPTPSKHLRGNLFKVLPMCVTQGVDDLRSKHSTQTRRTPHSPRERTGTRSRGTGTGAGK
eukprot:12061858-Prorocentrum_lima.AAC.1